MERLYGGRLHASPDGPAEPDPTAEDLLRLCRQEKIDVIVLRQGFRGLYAATDGSWFVYDCRELRSCLDH
jgi:hypothetical protein